MLSTAAYTQYNIEGEGGGRQEARGARHPSFAASYVRHRHWPRAPSSLSRAGGHGQGPRGARHAWPLQCWPEGLSRYLITPAAADRLARDIGACIACHPPCARRNVLFALRYPRTRRANRKPRPRQRRELRPNRVEVRVLCVGPYMVLPIFCRQVNHGTEANARSLPADCYHARRGVCSAPRPRQVLPVLLARQQR